MYRLGGELIGSSSVENNLQVLVHKNYRIMECLKLEEIHKDNQVQFLTPHKTTQNSSCISESITKRLLELSAVTTALWSLFHA